MTNYYSNIEDIIAKHLAGEAAPDESAMLDRWLNESEANRTYFETLEKIFFESASLRNESGVDTDAAWNKLKNELRKGEDGIRNLKPQTSNLRLFLRIAAAVVFVALMTTIYIFYFRENIQPVTIASANETKTVLLPDSSTALLNKNTTLAYTFTNDKREITLSGEAFFDVKHDETKPFIIHINDLQIEDIGTSFNVKAPEGSDSIQVIVETGIVKLTSGVNDSFENNCLIRPGQQAVYHKKSKKLVQGIVKDTNALAYRTKVFVFEKASLPVVAQKLKEVYGADIIISDKIKNCHITATFRNEKIEAIMDVIASTLNLKLIKNENKYILEGEGCEE